MPLDAILVKFEQARTASEDLLREGLRAALLDCRTIDVHAALSGRGVHAYAWLAVPALDEKDAIARFTGVLSRDAAGAEQAMPTILPLQLLLDLRGASASETPIYHYVVEAGVDADRELEFNAWYDTEHLPGLAAVPGCVRARRLRVLNNGNDRSNYIACYDLISESALTSDAWLAVRRTPWSDRVRPTFRDTKRTMFRTIVRVRADASTERSD